MDLDNQELEATRNLPCNKKKYKLKNNIESDLYEANNRINDLLDIVKQKDKEIDLMLEELTDCEFEMKCSECTYECEKDYDSLYQCNKEYFEERCSK